jgi:hypothetical protein
MIASASPGHVPFTRPTPAPKTGGASTQRPSAGGVGSSVHAFSPPPPLRLGAVGARSASGVADAVPTKSLLDVSSTAGASDLTATAAAAAKPAAAPAAAAAAPVGGYWVTAFGYQSVGVLGAVLDELRPSSGDILQHRLGAGPWVHVRFADSYQQQQALAKNGKVLHGAMIGVLEGIHPASADLLPATSIPGAGMPLRLQQSRPGGPGLRAPATTGRTELAKAGWWTRLCEFIFGW